AHASWLDQAELLLRAFSERYLKRGDWKSRLHLISHLEVSWREYNKLYAHPFTWSWTRQKMHRWVERHARVNLLKNLSNAPLAPPIVPAARDRSSVGSLPPPAASSLRSFGGVVLPTRMDRATPEPSSR